jgi:hypothetical protein
MLPLDLLKVGSVVQYERQCEVIAKYLPFEDIKVGSVISYKKKYSEDLETGACFIVLTTNKDTIYGRSKNPLFYNLTVEVYFLNIWENHKSRLVLPNWHHKIATLNYPSVYFENAEIL